MCIDPLGHEFPYMCRLYMNSPRCPLYPFLYSVTEDDILLTGRSHRRKGSEVPPSPDSKTGVSKHQSLS